MLNNTDLLKKDLPRIDPPCPAFGTCCGCSFQDIDYKDELALKENYLLELFQEHRLGGASERVSPIVASPDPYHYRNRLDLKLKRVLRGDIFIGFSPIDRRGIVPVDQCFIARQEISDAIPRVKAEVLAKLPDKYRLANITVRSGDDGRVCWGGIGKRSLHLDASDLLWTEIRGRRIFYSLDTFFQANLSILPLLIGRIASLPVWKDRPVFLDLYGGVGLFTFALAGKFEKAFLIEECGPSLDIARHNAAYHNMGEIEIKEGKVEQYLDAPDGVLSGTAAGKNVVTMIDPPRSGLSPKARAFFTQTGSLRNILYLSCNPHALAIDLKAFLGSGWSIEEIIPFDFFPRTAHLETLVLLHK